jgi:probable DNA metabolism protein
MPVLCVADFDDWRTKCRPMLAADVPPDEVAIAAVGENSLFNDDAGLDYSSLSQRIVRIPKRFVDMAKSVACHRDPERWNLLYRLAWRIVNESSKLLEIASDDDVRRFEMMEKSVRRDVHKTKAFVRFREIIVDGVEHFVAWHRPDHPILRLAAAFFARRFPTMRWTILTPDESAAWDLHELHFGPGAPASEAPPPDKLEEFWKNYYASIFNPARIKLNAMRKEMPVRHWPTLPEASLIPKLIAEAPSRVEEMITKQEGSAVSAADFIPADANWREFQSAAKGCQGCPLYKDATQTVFGEGSTKASMVLVGEAPGNDEDLEGRPFVGPAGKLLDDALAQAGVDRKSVYLTNAVKHFKFEPRGKMRLHKKPSAREMAACKPWVQEELRRIKPQVIVCLGATAAQTLIGRDFRITQRRGEVVATEYCPQTIATYHPSAVLRAPDSKAREAMRQALIDDLKKARGLVGARVKP